jgi:hypothetical protein
MEWRCSVLLGMKASRIFVIDISIEEIRDDLQHWLKEAYFIAWFAAKEKESLSLHRTEVYSATQCTSRASVEPAYLRSGKMNWDRRSRSLTSRIVLSRLRRSGSGFSTVHCRRDDEDDFLSVFCCDVCPW